MLIALRAILLVLFIAAPFGEQRTADDPYQVPAEFAVDAILTCPLHKGGSREVDIWTAGKAIVADSDTSGGA